MLGGRGVGGVGGWVVDGREGGREGHAFSVYLWVTHC